MIVDSMTDLEVFHEIGRDRETVWRWFRTQLRERRREMLKSKRFPKRFWLEYTSQRMVQYMIGVTIFDRRMRGMAVVFMALRRMQEGISVYNTWLDSDDENPQMVLTPHALKQYGKRMGIDKSGVELVKEFFNRNNSCHDSFNQRAVGRSVRYNGEKHISGCVKDGVLLGQLHNGNIHVVRTFITYDMCSGLQEEVFGQYNGHHRTYEDQYKIVKNKPVRSLNIEHEPLNIRSLNIEPCGAKAAAVRKYIAPSDADPAPIRTLLRGLVPHT
jgi:hypothetical protein